MTSRLILAVLMAQIAACGGKAIIDAGAQNQGGGGADVATTTVATTTNVVNVGVGPGVGGATGGVACEEACNSLADCGGPPMGCVDSCINVGPGCQQFHQRWLSCSLGEVNTMCGGTGPAVCGPDLSDYLECSGILAGETCLKGDDGSCTCDAFVGPGVVLEQECSPGNGCTCFAGGAVIGFCEANDFSCGIGSGCCAGLFFTGPT